MRPILLYVSKFLLTQLIIELAQANAIATVNASGNISAIMHPVGFMYKKDEIVYVQANDFYNGNHKSVFYFVIL